MALKANLFSCCQFITQLILAGAHGRLLGQVTGLRECKSGVSAQETLFKGRQLVVSDLGAQRGQACTP